MSSLIDLMKQVKPYLPKTIVSILLFLYHRVYLRSLTSYLELLEKKSLKEYGYPSAGLRLRVSGHPDLESFLSAGQRCRDDIVAALDSLSLPIQKFSSVLDFGCGCGRTLRWFKDLDKEISFSGCDIDVDAINYCKQAFTDYSFTINDIDPPCKYADASFDLIYAISVFTHLNEERQFLWLTELHRMLKPNGILLASLHGEHSWSNMPSQRVHEIKTSGILFVKEDIWKGIFPDGYQTTYHTKEYVLKNFNNQFEILSYFPQRIHGYQDLVALRKII